jgi:uncharacterized lipoprotein YddW (UPF0748 family)
MKLLRTLPIAYCLLSIAHCLLPIDAPAQTKPEFRGVWVATVTNIDWPSASNLSSDVQKAEFINPTV